MRTKAYTLSELLGALAVGALLVLFTTRAYTVGRRALQLAQLRSDMQQNARVAMDRIVREYRMSPSVVTDLSSTPVNEIEFENGDSVGVSSGDRLTYRRYYMSGTTLRLDVRECYFTSSPATRVRFDETLDGDPPTCVAIAGRTQDIAYNVSSLAFTQTNDIVGNPLVGIYIITNNNGALTYHLKTAIRGRNL